eukprot:gb/GECH01011967.1/.p1 GENE.gb/GECH01011967.1/~~gb/GECH01011967.1/.p1  ORF type:complete len:238 (+),score=51.04 gb/GECH01011967.1/:1-714(+)
MRLLASNHLTTRVPSTTQSNVRKSSSLTNNLFGSQSISTSSKINTFSRTTTRSFSSKTSFWNRSRVLTRDSLASNTMNAVKPNVLSQPQKMLFSSENSPPSDLFKIGNLNHVAIAVPDLPKATAMYRDVLGAEVSEPKDQPDHGVTVVFVNLGNTKIELIHPLGEKSPIQNFIDKKPTGGIHHICLEVEDIYKAVEQVKQNNVRPLDPEPKIGAHDKPVVFLHPKDCNGVLIELQQI